MSLPRDLLYIFRNKSRGIFRIKTQHSELRTRGFPPNTQVAEYRNKCGILRVEKIILRKKPFLHVLPAVGDRSLQGEREALTLLVNKLNQTPASK